MVSSHPEWMEANKKHDRLLSNMKEIEGKLVGGWISSLLQWTVEDAGLPCSTSVH